MVIYSKLRRLFPHFAYASFTLSCVEASSTLFQRDPMAIWYKKCKMAIFIPYAVAKGAPGQRVEGSWGEAIWYKKKQNGDFYTICHCEGSSRAVDQRLRRREPPGVVSKSRFWQEGYYGGARGCMKTARHAAKICCPRSRGYAIIHRKEKRPPKAARIAEAPGGIIYEAQGFSHHN